MSRALLLAHKCQGSQDVPVGAVVIDPSGRVIGEGWNQREEAKDPTAHAEILALREAGKTLGSWNLSGCTLVVTLEPCTMCAGAIVQSRVDRVVFGAWDPKTGAAGSVRDVVRDARLNHQVEVVPGVLEDQASVQVRGFFAQKRMETNKDSDFWQKRIRRKAPKPVRAWDRPDSTGAAVEPVGTALPSVPPAPVAPAASHVPVAPLPARRRSDRHAGKVQVPPLAE